MITLAQMRMVKHGELLQQEDCHFANALLQQGHSKDEVMVWVKSWAKQYASDIVYEDRMAKDFERNAYGS